jgi:hypothetical protein
LIIPVKRGAEPFKYFVKGILTSDKIRNQVVYSERIFGKEKIQFAIVSNAYLNYLTNNWSREHSGESLMKMSHVREMKKINEQYWNVREIDVNTIVFLADTDVTQSILQDRRQFSPSVSIPVLANNPNIQIGFRNGRLKLGNA